MPREARKVFTSVSLDKEIIETVDKRRREMALKEGKDVPRSAYINDLLIRALKEVR